MAQREFDKSQIEVIDELAEKLGDALSVAPDELAEKILKRVEVRFDEYQKSDISFATLMEGFRPAKLMTPDELEYLNALNKRVNTPVQGLRS